MGIVISLTRIGYVWFPHLPVQAAILRHPSLRDRSLVVVGGADGRERVVDASDDCLSAGVQRGMAVREAAELVPSATFLPPDPGGNADMLERAFDLLERFAESVETNGREGAWFLPAGLPAHPLPSRGVEERRLGATIVDGMAATLGLDSRVGIGPGKLVARVAAERAAPGAVDSIATGDAAAYLASLPITLLPLLPRSVERLKLLGIATIGAFARLPADTLPRRFGPEASLAWRIAHGDDVAPLVPRQRPEAWSMRQTFDPPIEDRELLLSTARALLDRLSRPLQDQRRAFRSLWITIGLEDGRVVNQHANLRAPTNDPRQCLSLLRGMVEALVLERSAAQVTVRIEAIEREPAVQGELFDRAGIERRERVIRAFSEIARRYRGRVRRIVPGDNPTSLFLDRRLLLLPYEAGPDGAPASQDLAEPATRSRPVHLIARGDRIYLVETGAEAGAPGASPADMGGERKDEVVALHARWEADDWWPEATRWTYYRVRTRHGLIATLARDHDRQRWLLVESLD